MHEKSKTKLSSNVLEMKFMKKSKEKCEKEAEEEERKILFKSEEDPDILIKGGDTCVMEPSFVPCLQLLNGRFSFKGMNPEIERLMRDAELKDPAELKRMDGISDKDMANRYSTLVGTMQKKFTSKRKWTSDGNNNNNRNEGAHRSKPSYSSYNNERQRKFRKPKD